MGSLGFRNANQGASIGYDAAGRRIRDGLHEYEYNGTGRLARVLDSDSKEELGSFIYDGTGKRVSERWSEDPGSIYRMYAGEEPQLEIRSDGSYSIYVYGDTGLWARLDNSSAGKSPVIRYVHRDYLGSTIALTNESGRIAWPDPNRIQRYHPYGEPFVETPDTKDIPGFTGKRIDPQTHIHYFNARHYSGTIGNDLGTPRFLTPDPIFGDLADPLSWNRYAYCRGNPVNRVDPNGLDSFVFYHAQHFEKQAESQIPV
jgi:RHS repeat-associated protein